MSVPRAFPDYIVDYIAGPVASGLLATSAMPSWVVNPSNPPDLMFNWSLNQAWIKSTCSIVPASSLIACSRASQAYVNDSAGNWTLFQTGDGSPASGTAARMSGIGMLGEDSKTNSIRNNSAQGAVVGVSRTVVVITSLSRTASTTAVAAASGTNVAVGDLVTITNASIAAYNGNFVVSAASAGVSFSYVTGSSSTDSATGASYTAISPGTLPNNMGFGNDASPGAFVVGVGAQNGVDTVDIRFAGLAGGIGVKTMTFEGNTAIAALPGQTWIGSAFIQSVGTPNGLTGENLFISERNTGGGNVGGSAGTPVLNAWNRYTNAWTLQSGVCVFVNEIVALNYVAASQPDFTLRIGWPQLENLTASLPAVAASGTKQVAGATYVNGATTFTVAGGTGTAAIFNVTIAANGLSTVDSVNNAGSYTVPPTPNASGFYTGTVASGNGDGTASISIAWTDSSTKAFASSPIRTTAAAATRAADVISLISALVFGSAYSMYGEGTPQMPVVWPTQHEFLSMNAGTTGSNVHIRREPANSFTGFFTPTNGGLFSASAWPANTSQKAAAAVAAGDNILAVQGVLTAAGVGALGTTPNQVNFLCQPNGILQFNGFQKTAGIWFTQRIPNGQLTSVTTP